MLRHTFLLPDNEVQD